MLFCDCNVYLTKGLLRTMTLSWGRDWFYAKPQAQRFIDAA